MPSGPGRAVRLAPLDSDWLAPVPLKRRGGCSATLRFASIFARSASQKFIPYGKATRSPLAGVAGGLRYATSVLRRRPWAGMLSGFALLARSARSVSGQPRPSASGSEYLAVLGRSLRSLLAALALVRCANTSSLRSQCPEMAPMGWKAVADLRVRLSTT